MNIYVGNLSWTLTDLDLQNLFSPFGEVSAAKVVTDKFNGNRSKGFGFVEMPNDEEANAAIAALNQTEVQGRSIIVNDSQPRQQKERKPFGGGGNSGWGGFNKGGGGGGYKRRDF